MSDKILVTDTLFIFDEHLRKLKDAGFEVVRLNKPKATEEELCKAIKGKIGYILGGMERVTKRVIEAADDLKVISFTGIGYKGFIPGWEYAKERDITITNAPDGPTQAVAEWAITAALVMNREFFELGRAGKRSFAVTKGIEGQNIGIVGFGRIGTQIGEMIKVFRPNRISYFSKSHHQDKEHITGIDYKPVDELLKSSDIVFLCVSDDAGENFFGAKELNQMKKNSLLVSFMHPGILNKAALHDALTAEKIRAISDYPMDERFNDFSLSTWYCMNGTNTITEGEVQLTSDLVTDSIINVLKTGKDKYQVN